jgi:hypothetical protein
MNQTRNTSARTKKGGHRHGGLALGVAGFSYGDLYDSARLQGLLVAFDDTVRQQDSGLFSEYKAYRESFGDGLSPKETSSLLVRMAPYVGRFVARLFDVEAFHQVQAESMQDEVEHILTYRNEIVMRVGSKYKGQNVAEWDIAGLERELETLRRVAFPEIAADEDAERVLSTLATRIYRLAEHYRQAGKGKQSQYSSADGDLKVLRGRLAQDPEAKEVLAEILSQQGPLVFADRLLDVIQRWSYAALNDPALAKCVAGWASFKKPAKTDFEHLVPYEIVEKENHVTLVGPKATRRRRDGFALTDKRFNQREILYELDHCIYCHETDTDRKSVV